MKRAIAPGPDTVFLIGSLSKQFIATGVMLLVQDGELAVGDRVDRSTRSSLASPFAMLRNSSPMR